MMNHTKILIIHKHPSHHQMPLADALHSLCGNSFRIAFLDPWQPDRMGMGWPKLGEYEPWVIRVWEGDNAYKNLKKWNDEADAVIYPGYNVWELPSKLIIERLNHGKLCLPTSERMFKPSTDLITGWGASRRDETLRPLRHIVRRTRGLYQGWKINKPQCHYLASGSYAAYDQRKIGMFKNRLWTWGFFLELSDIRREIIPTTPLKILWAGRMFKLKNVHVLLLACSVLKNHNIPFELTVIGDGPDRKYLESLAVSLKLNDLSIFIDPLPPDSVRSFMRSSHIFVLPSTGDEGWGAVLNEAMSEGCAVIGSTGAGASRILIKDEQNGLLFPTGDAAALAEKLEFLARNPDKREKMGLNAAKYMREVWSPAVGAERLVALVNGLLGRRPMPDYSEGPCSKAKIWKDTKYDRVTYSDF